MNINPNHHLAIHGHFYQPPRENPWLGIIEDQESARPFSNWNTRICAECYTPLTCSPICDESNRTTDLFNCYAHISYNFGPTLLSWLDKYAPCTIERLEIADKVAKNSYNGFGSAMAQVYNHQILPLSDAKDKHTQILWGIKEFYYRFNRKPLAMWLSETAIDMNTVRALIDHGIKYIILSPLQASYIREFGEFEWTGVPDGTIDTRSPYRLFEVDGGGRTHFNRYLDVLFYDKNISTKISFEHLLTDSNKLEWLIKERYSEEATLPQLVLIATDGEIYGHHEKNGNKHLAKIINQFLSTGTCSVTNLEKFIDENKPSQEVKLWEGVDGKGSSWSCSHGVGRWHTDCGCSDGPYEYNQQWREYLRNAFDELRFNIRNICEKISSELLYDFTDARNDYISVVLEPTQEIRDKFLERHAKEKLSQSGQIKLWKILEADRNAMLMYTSCGWFFSDISGFEPQQNMRYALRAAELVQDYSDYNLISLLQDRLNKAVSNIPNMGTGQDIFNKFVLTTRYTPKHLTAVFALLSLYQLPLPKYDSKVELSNTEISSKKEMLFITGSSFCTDKFTLEKKNYSFLGFTDLKTLSTGVCFTSDIAEAKKLTRLTSEELQTLVNNGGIKASELPYTERRLLNHKILNTALTEADQNLHNFFNSHKSIFEHFTTNYLPIPTHLKAIGEEALSFKLKQCIKESIIHNVLSDTCINEVHKIKKQAHTCGLNINMSDSSRIMAKFFSNKLMDLRDNLSEESVFQVLSLLKFIQDNEFWLENWDELLDIYWRVLHLPPRIMPKSRKIIDNMRIIGDRLYFSKETIKHLTQILFSTPV